MYVEVDGDIMKQRRKDMKITQQQLADKAIVTKQNISRIELRGVTKVELDTLECIARTLDCSVEYLQGIAINPVRPTETEERIKELISTAERLSNYNIALLTDIAENLLKYKKCDVLTSECHSAYIINKK